MKLRLDELEVVARRAGFEDYKALLTQWYLADRMSLTTIAERLYISWPRVKKHLKLYGLEIRNRGGANNVQVVLTMDLIHEIARDGLPAVAGRLGVQYSVLNLRVREWMREHPDFKITIPE